MRSGILRGLFEADQAEAGEPGVPLDVGLLGGVAESAETDGSADFFADAGDFAGCLGERACGDS